MIRTILIAAPLWSLALCVTSAYADDPCDRLPTMDERVACKAKEIEDIQAPWKQKDAEDQAAKKEFERFIEAEEYLPQKYWFPNPGMTPIEKFKIVTDKAVEQCNRIFEMAQGSWVNVASAARNCAPKELQASMPYYKAAAKGLKTAAAREALKNVWVAYTVSLEAIYPQNDEAKLTYKARQATNRDKLTEAWAHFDLEH